MSSTRFCVIAGQDSEMPETGGRRIWWDRPEAPHGEVSVPALLEAKIPRIRAELMAWVYDLGRWKIAGREVQDYCKAGDALSMWWCSLIFEKHPKMLPGLYEALKLRALELFLEENACSELRLVGGDKKLRSALAAFCRAGKPTFTYTPSPAAAHAHLRKRMLSCLYYALPAPCKGLLRFMHWLFSVKRLLPRTRARRPAHPQAATIATYFPNIDPGAAGQGRFRSRYWETLHDALVPAAGEGHRVNWLFIMFPSPQYSLQRCIELLRIFRTEARDGASFHYLEEFLDGKDIADCILRWARLFATSLRIRREARRQFYFRDSGMDLWPYLGGAFIDSLCGWRALERCLQRRACTRYAQWCGRQDWTVFPMENCPWERMLTQALHEAGAGPVYGAQHSTVRPSDFRYFDDQRALEAEDCRIFQPDRIFTNGLGAGAEMTAAGYAANTTGVLEALRYLYLAGSKKRRDTREERRLVVVTSFFADETDVHLRVLAEAVREGVFDALPVIVKPHPYLDVKSRPAWCFPADREPEISVRPLEELFAPGTIVWASNSTTAALEAAFLGLQVMVQAAENDFDLCPLHNLPGVARIRNCADAARALTAPSTPELPEEYLALDPALPRWRALLHL